MGKLTKWLDRNKQYQIVHRDGLNVLEETPASFQRRSEWRERFNVFLSLISAIAAVIAAIFAAAAYINA